MYKNSYSEGVLVKNDLTGEVLTIDKMVSIIRSEVRKSYYSYSHLRRSYDLDDVVQDIVCYYFSPMKKQPVTRLVHYSELYNNNINYLTNLFKLTSRQWLNMLCRNKDVKNNPLSLNTVVSKFDENLGELQDFIKDDTCASVLLEKELLTDLLRDLHIYNCNQVFKKFGGNVTYTKFYSNPYNMIEVAKLTSRQENLIMDFLNGYSKVELKLKYEDYPQLLKAIKFVLGKRKRVESF